MEIKQRKELFYNLGLIVPTIILSILFVFLGSNPGAGKTLLPGSISDRTIQAPRDIENTIATQEARMDAYNSVVPSYTRNTKIEDTVKNNISEFFSALDEKRTDYKLEITKVSKNIVDDGTGETTLEPPNQIQIDTIVDKIELPVYFSDNQKGAILSVEDNEYIEFKEKIHTIVENLFDQGIQGESGDSKEMNAVYVKVKDDLEKEYGNSELRMIGYEIITFYLEANVVIDHGKTEKARQDAMDEVEPIIYKKGQTIVDAGYSITEEAYEVIKTLGYTQNDYGENLVFLFGSGILIIVSILIIVYFIYTNDVIELNNRREKTMICIIYNLCIVFIWILKDLPYYAIPILVFTMLFAILINRNFAILINVFFVLMTYLIARLDIEHQIYFMIAGVVVAVFSKELNERSKALFVGFIVSGINSLVIFAILLVTWNSMSTRLIKEIIYVFVSVIGSVIIAMGSLPFWEAAFGVITPLKLLDLTNPSNLLLRRLTVEAPGTYHHSLIVANLAEAAAIEIGANPIVARVGGYYHDVGKLKYPKYFSENQIGKNPHDVIEPLQSVQIIREHVTYGLELARENNLPKVIKEMISMHHGTTTIKYFYYKDKKEHPNEKINEDDYKYTYSIPTSKEVAIVMLADTAEAAVRSLIPSGKTFEDVEKFTNQLIKDKLDEGQLLESKLTIKDLKDISNAFLRVFKGMYHERISYPPMDKIKKMREENNRLA